MTEMVEIPIDFNAAEQLADQIMKIVDDAHVGTLEVLAACLDVAAFQLGSIRCRNCRKINYKNAVKILKRLTDLAVAQRENPDIRHDH